MKKDFEIFLKTLQSSIITWDYFCDFEKAHKNTFEVRVQLNILNSLLGEKNLKDKFFKIIEKYPDTRKALLILIATRINKIKDLPIVNPKNLLKENKKHLFDKKEELTSEIKNELWDFIDSTGLKNVFEDKKVTNLEDYVFGVEVGLDSNARKNRTGKIMENTVEIFISNFCDKNKLEYIPQATKSKILSIFGIDIKMQAAVKNKNGERKFDFAIFERNKNKLTLVEVNYYSSTGSKPSSIAREYIDLSNILKTEGIRFIWVTDGYGWIKMKNPLEKTINESDYVVNLEMLKNGILDEIINE
jgi:type II restriction enzyme